nr:MAG TPA: hypothetical protein [Caudoviricetes sp.]
MIFSTPNHLQLLHRCNFYNQGTDCTLLITS